MRGELQWSTAPGGRWSPPAPLDAAHGTCYRRGWIVIRMYFSDHEPPHFHAQYGEFEALVEIETLALLRGELPRRAMALVLEWAALHRQELRSDWERARTGTPVQPIAPLDRSRHEISPRLCSEADGRPPRATDLNRRPRDREGCWAD